LFVLDGSFEGRTRAQGASTTSHSDIRGLPEREPDASLEDAALLMVEKKIGCLPVVENGRLVGILTEGDIVAQLAERKKR
jgi:CBS domain-containing protein